jgi:hypothetical protein
MRIEEKGVLGGAEAAAPQSRSRAAAGSPALGLAVSSSSSARSCWPELRQISRTVRLQAAVSLLFRNRSSALRVARIWFQLDMLWDANKP